MVRTQRKGKILVSEKETAIGAPQSDRERGICRQKKAAGVSGRSRASALNFAQARGGGCAASEGRPAGAEYHSYRDMTFSRVSDRVCAKVTIKRGRILSGTFGGMRGEWEKTKS